MNIPVIKTPRLILRAFTLDDFEAYATMSADPEFMRYIGDGKPASREDAWRHIAYILGHWTLLGYGLWALEERESGAMIGRIGLINPEGWPGLEVGWALARSHWGKGYATEGAKAAVDWAFEHLETDELISLIDPENIKSARVAERIGETLKEKIVFRGKPINIYALRRAAV